MKKFILEKNLSTGMTVHPFTSQPSPTVTHNQPSQLPSSSSSSPSSTPSSLSPNSIQTNGYPTNNHSHKSSPRGVNSNQLIHPSTANPINSIGNHNHNDSGFQPYRGPVPANSSSLEDGLLSSVQQQQSSSSTGPSSDNQGPSSSSSAAASNLANHILPYSERLRSAAVAAGYSYNPFIGSPSHANPSAPMPPSQSTQPPHHSLSTHPLPPQTYRIDDPIYLERYGLMRSTANNLHQTSTVQSLNHSDLSPGHSSTNSNVPSYQMSSRYSELLATHQERVLNEEKQRLLGHGSNSNHHPTHSHSHSHPPISSSGPTNYKIHSSTSDHGSRNRDYPNNGNILSGMSVREMNSSSNVNKKHQLNGSVTISNPGSRPMNLTSNTTSVNQTHKNNSTSAILIDLKKEHPSSHASQQFGPSFQATTTFNPVTTTSSSTVNNHLWRPQISERDDSRHHINSSGHNSRMFPDKRNVAFEVPIDYSNSKKQRFSDLPGDFSYKPSPSIEHQPESFISSNHSPFYMNSSQDVQVHLLKSRPPPPQPSSQVSQPQHPSPPPLRQINLNNNNIPQSKKLNDGAPQSRLPLRAHQPPQLQVQLKDQSPIKIEENIEKVISKLDVMEMKLKLKRRERAERAVSRGSVETSEDEDDLIYSDDEISDEEASELKKTRQKLKYMVTSGPPAKLENTPEKVEYLRALGLVTPQVIDELNFEKYVTRRRFRSKIDANPFVATDVPKPELFDSENVFLQPTDILPNSLFKSEPKLEDKFNYMNLLGLRHEMNTEEIKKREQIWEGVLEERDRRRSINLSYGKITNNLTKEALEKWFQYLTTQPRVYNNNHDRYNKNGYLTNHNLNHKPVPSSGSSFTSPPSLESDSAPSPVNSSWHNQRRTLNVTSDRKQSKHSKAISRQKNLLQSLDNREISSSKSSKSNNVDDLLSNSTSTRLNNKLKSDNLLTIDSDHRESKDSEAPGQNDSPASGFKWPGIEAIIQSYEKYAIANREEKESLNQRIGQLKLTIREKTNAVDKLTKKMSSLTKSQKEMDEEREQYERRINSIKTNLKEIVS